MKLCLAEIIVIVLLLLLGGLCCVEYAYSAPPAGTDPNSPIAQWYQSLKQPTSGMGCCGMDRDCRPVESRNGGKTGIQALLASPWPDDGYGRKSPQYWVDVPQDVILQRTDNPVGKAVACISPIDWKQDEDAQPVWYCFVMPYLY